MIYKNMKNRIVSGVLVVILGLSGGNSTNRDIVTDLNAKVNEAIEVLAPHFGMEAELARLERPEVRYYAEETAKMQYRPNSGFRLVFGRGTEWSDIGHEVAHWFHYQINQKIFNPKVEVKEKNNEKIQINYGIEMPFDRKVFTEALAVIGGCIVARENGELLTVEEIETLNNFRNYSLSELARMDLEEAKNTAKRAGYDGNYKKYEKH